MEKHVYIITESLNSNFKKKNFKKDIQLLLKLYKSKLIQIP